MRDTPPSHVAPKFASRRIRLELRLIGSNVDASRVRLVIDDISSPDFAQMQRTEEMFCVSDNKMRELTATRMKRRLGTTIAPRQVRTLFLEDGMQRLGHPVSRASSVARLVI